MRYIIIALALLPFMAFAEVAGNDDGTQKGLDSSVVMASDQASANIADTENSLNLEGQASDAWWGWGRGWGWGGYYGGYYGWPYRYGYYGYGWPYYRLWW